MRIASVAFIIEDGPGRREGLWPRQALCKRRLDGHKRNSDHGQSSTDIEKSDK